MSPTELYEKIDQLKCFEQLVGYDRLGIKFCAPHWMRQDKRPDCKLHLSGGRVRFFDPARDLNIDLIDTYKMWAPGSTWEQLEEDLLRWSGSASPTSQQIRTGSLYQPKFTLTPMVREWTEWGIEFWKKRGITTKRLAGLVQEIYGYEMVGQNDMGDFRQEQYANGFVYWCNDKPKCYFPDAPKERKFRGHFREDDVWVFDRSERRAKLGLPDTKTLLISKSNKDLLCWSTIVNCDLMNLSAEGVFPTINFLLTRVRIPYERVVICLDPDETGVKGANKLQSILFGLSDIGTFDVKVWNWPDPVSKDLDKYLVDHGKKDTIKFIKANGFHRLFNS